MSTKTYGKRHQIVYSVISGMEEGRGIAFYFLHLISNLIFDNTLFEETVKKALLFKEMNYWRRSKPRALCWSHQQL